jgi:EmrB/QacA subfamily drug resistance transporter
MRFPTIFFDTLNTEQTNQYYADNPAARKVALWVIAICHFLVTLTLSSTFVAIPDIGRDLSSSAVLLSWVPTAFLLANVVTLLPFGRLADNYGRRRIFGIGLTVFLVGTLIAGLAPNMPSFLTGRLVQGVGGAMIYSCGLAMLLGIYSGNSQGFAIGFTMGATYFGLSCGPLLGGLFTEHLGWRSLFLGLLLPGVVMIYLLYKRLHGDWKSAALEPFDIIGSLLMGFGVVLISIGLSLLPTSIAIASLLTGAMLLALFIYHELRCPHPLVRIRVMYSNRDFFNAFVASNLMYASYYPVFFLISLYLQLLLGLTPIEAGAVIFVQAIFMSIFAPVAGRFSDRYSPAAISGVGCLLQAIGFLLLLGLGADTWVLRIIIAVSFIGVGFGLFSTPNNTRALKSVDAGRLGIASALMNLARNFGNIFGSAMVLGLISALIGHQAIEPQHYPMLLRVIHIVFAFSLAYALYAAWLCLGRKNTG